jgi:hypothetical protein
MAVRHGWTPVAVMTHSEKRYDSIGSAPAGVVGVGSTLIPGHVRLGRLDEAAGVCGGRVELWVLNWVPDFG